MTSIWKNFFTSSLRISSSFFTYFYFFYIFLNSNFKIHQFQNSDRAIPSHFVEFRRICEPWVCLELWFELNQFFDSMEDLFLCCTIVLFPTRSLIFVVAPWFFFSLFVCEICIATFCSQPRFSVRSCRLEPRRWLWFRPSFSRSLPKIWDFFWFASLGCCSRERESVRLPRWIFWCAPQVSFSLRPSVSWLVCAAAGWASLFAALLRDLAGLVAIDKGIRP
jgi:hypothetical protein